jgi:hydroxyethylthiazole kinase-like uncharacterized protein yjeF
MPGPVIVEGPGPNAQGWPLHDAAASRRIEAAAAASRPAHALMARAGLGIARLALALQPHTQRIHVMVGPGNNGGDGLIAARHLQCVGLDVTVTLLQGNAASPADAADALQQARDGGVAIAAGLEASTLARTDLCIDALLGLGLRRPPQGELRGAIEAINHSGKPVLAADLPSGLDSDTGRALDDQATVQARWTLSLLTLKPGLFTAAGRDHAGQVWFDDLGVDAAGEPALAHLITDITPMWPLRRHRQHKGSFGDVWVVGGAPGMRGAVWLAARAALTAGAGRVMVVPMGAGDAGFDDLHPELMLRDRHVLQATPSPIEQATVVCGCGGGDAVRELLPELISRAGALVLDADAINALAADRAMAEGLARRAARGQPTLMTPHPLEAARWLGSDTAAVQADRLKAARTLAAQTRSNVVLKGSGSVIAEPGGSAWINASGNAALATAGTGDVLAGWIGGLWSQGLDAITAMKLGVHAHGLAADRWAERQAIDGPLVASRLIDELRELRAGPTTGH